MQVSASNRRNNSRRFLAALGVFLACLLPTPAPAQNGEGRLGFSLAHYERTMQSRDDATTNVLSWYLDGVRSGIAWSLADHRARSQPLLFCLPDSLKMTVQEIKASIAAELMADGEFWRRTPDVPIERVLVQGLKRRFPCRS